MVFPKSFTSFMLMAFFPPFSFPFFLFFFLNKHFLQIQKQQVRTKRTATMAMAIKAHGGTERKKCTENISNKTHMQNLFNSWVIINHSFLFTKHFLYSRYTSHHCFIHVFSARLLFLSFLLRPSRHAKCHFLPIAFSAPPT